MAIQAQVGTVQVSADSNPAGGVMSGITNGMEWAARSQQLASQSDAIKQRADAAKLQRVAAQMKMGEDMHKQMLSVLSLPKGPTKKVAIKEFHARWEGAGFAPHPTTLAMLDDDNFSAGLLEQLSDMEKDPAGSVQKASLPYLIGSEGTVSLFKDQMDRRSREKNAYMTSIATTADKAAQREITKKMHDETMTGQKTRQDDQQAFTGDQNDSNRKLEEKKFFIVERNKKMETLKVDTKKADDDFRDPLAALKRIKKFAANPSGVGDQAILGAGQVLTEGKVSVLRQEDVKRLGSTGGAFDRMKGALSNLKGDGTLGPKARADFARAANEMEVSYIRAYMDRISPTLEAVNSEKFAPKDIFTADQFRILGAAGLLGKGATKPSVNAKPPAPAQRPTAGQATPPAAVPTQALSAPQLQQGKALFQQAGADPVKRAEIFTKIEIRLKRKLTPQEKRALITGG